VSHHAAVAAAMVTLLCSSDTHHCVQQLAFNESNNLYDGRDAMSTTLYSAVQ